MCWNGHLKWPHRHALLFTHTYREAILSRLVQGMWLSCAIVFTTPWIHWKNLSKFLCNKELKRLPETTTQACTVVYTHTHREAILSRLVQGMWLSCAIVFTTPWIQWKNLSKFLRNDVLKRLPETTTQACTVVYTHTLKSNPFPTSTRHVIVMCNWLSCAIGWIDRKDMWVACAVHASLVVYPICNTRSRHIIRVYSGTALPPLAPKTHASNTATASSKQNRVAINNEKVNNKVEQ